MKTTVTLGDLISGIYGSYERRFRNDTELARVATQVALYDVLRTQVDNRAALRREVREAA